MNLGVLVAGCLLASRATAQPSIIQPLAEGTSLVRVSVEAELTRHRVLQPLSLAPDVGAGVAAGWTLLGHSSSEASARAGAGHGLCLRGRRETLGAAPPTCDARLAGAGVSVIRELTSTLSARVGLTAPRLEPLATTLLVQVIVRARHGATWLLAQPAIASGMTAREVGNRERLLVPVRAGRDIGAGEAHLRTGIEGAFSTFDETYRIPLGIGASVRLGGLRIGVEASLDRALGPLNATSWRSAVAFVDYSRERAR
jgi:hypothetical protein